MVKALYKISVAVVLTQLLKVMSEGEINITIKKYSNSNNAVNHDTTQP